LAHSLNIIQTDNFQFLSLKKWTLFQLIALAFWTTFKLTDTHDAMYLIHLRSEQAVFSHETALFLHNMTDREPNLYSVTVKSGYNPHRLKEDGIKVYTIKAEIHEMGLSQAETPFGHLVPVYDKERTLCDILRNRRKVDKQILLDALKSYSKRQDKDLRRLMNYAETFKVKNVLKPYLEVLL
jgi:predicted transcriptional regulator of viral defense system